MAATLTATPNPVVAGEEYSLSGCGYEMRAVEVRINNVSAYAIGMRNTPDGACLDGNYWVIDEPGTYAVEVWQQNAKGKKKTLVASTSLTVTAA
jgi:hypothetical protein